MSKGLLDIVIDSIFNEKWVGKQGEKLTVQELNLVNIFGRKGKALRNLYVPKDDGTTSEIDVVYITQKGIFVFESKNYSGWIFGDEKDLYWTASLQSRQKNRFYNPIKQNRSHLKWLNQFLGDGIPLFSVIVFSERCELKKVSVESPNVRVIKRSQIFSAVREIWNDTPDVLTEEQVTGLFDRLGVLTHAEKSVKQEHIRNIEKRFGAAGQTAPPDTGHVEPAAGNNGADHREDGDKTPEKRCPRCGKKLVLRTAKKGPSAGKQFLGCSGYPNCRYIENLGAVSADVAQ